MSYIYTTGICELKGIDNKNLIAVICYIAEKENYICAGNIMYKKLYYEVFRSQVIEIFRQNNINSFPSRIQFKRLFCSHSGKIPKNAAVYLWVIYAKLISYHERIDINISGYEHVHYTRFVANLIRKEFDFIIVNQTINGKPLTPIEFNEFSTASQYLDEVDFRVNRTTEQIINNE